MLVLEFAALLMQYWVTNLSLMDLQLLTQISVQLSHTSTHQTLEVVLTIFEHRLSRSNTFVVNKKN